MRWFSSVAQACPTLCNLMNRSTPGLPVYHQLLEFTQTHVHWVSYAFQPSHPLSSPSPPALNLLQHQGLFIFFFTLFIYLYTGSFQMSQFFASGGQSIRVSAVTSVLSMNTQDRSPCSPGVSQESSPTPQFKSINSSTLSFLYSPTVTFIHDHWKNQWDGSKRLLSLWKNT